MNTNATYIQYLDKLRKQTEQLNKEEKRRGVLLLFPGTTEEEASVPRISAERHARIPYFQYFLQYIRAMREDHPEDKRRF